ncbi:MAG TPA: glycoside hydrolase domain-containing protein [Candidatus Limnocylindrales bacterium]|nr:glycoside hydrolase domain-containing protein [Candidatus Limnocylindrales bacterium]
MSLLSVPMVLRRLVVLTVLVLAAVVAVMVVDLGPVTVTRNVYRRVLKIADQRNRWLEPAGKLPHEDSSVTAADMDRGFYVFTRSILERVLPSSIADAAGRPARIRLEAAWNQYEAAQIGVRALHDLDALTIRVSDLHDADGHVLAASSVDIRMERFYALPLSIRVHNRFGVVPKTLEPAVAIRATAATTRPYWLTVHVPDRQAGGLYRGTVTASDSQHADSVPIEVDVLAGTLDEAPLLLGPLSLPVLRNFPHARGRRAEQILDHADIIFRDVREHGMTTLSLWSGRVVRRDDGRLVLPDLDEAIRLYARYGFPRPLIYAPVNLLSTNKLGRSSTYRHYDRSVAVPLAREIASVYGRRAAEAGLPGLILDPIEEPNYALGVDRHDAPDLRQRIATELLAAVKQGGGTTAMTCTPETAAVGAGNLDYWLVAFKRFTPGVYEKARRAGAHTAMYANSTLTGNGTSFSRFFFGYYPWANRLDGMTAWTYPMTPKRFPVNMDAKRAEGPLDVREGFLGSDGRPVPVIQWELAREGVDDLRYLTTLERLRAEHCPAGAAVAASDADPCTRAGEFLESVRSAVARDPHRYTFEDPRTLEPIAAFQWTADDFAARRHRSFELVRELSALDR